MALDTVVDKVNIASHQPVPVALVDSVAVAVVDMNPSMDEFVPHSAFSQLILLLFCFFFGIGEEGNGKKFNFR